MAQVVDLIAEDMELQGTITFPLADPELLNAELKEYAVFYKIVGESRMKLFRNNRMELVFVRLNDDWMRQAKIALNGVSLPLTIRLKWDNATSDELAIKTPDQQDFTAMQAVQIDN